jgi:ATPase subunit of ABC transporter with duplicated ATPase domains
MPSSLCPRRPWSGATSPWTSAPSRYAVSPCASRRVRGSVSSVPPARERASSWKSPRDSSDRVAVRCSATESTSPRLPRSDGASATSRRTTCSSRISTSRANLLYGATAKHPATLARLDTLCADLGISHLLGRRIHTISGGEAQRVALARALLSGHDLLLLDECTSALDEETRAFVGRLLLTERRQRGLSVVQVTHDPEEAAQLADVIVTLAAGRIVRVETSLQPRRSGGTP